jgi:hypothetical protein
MPLSPAIADHFHAQAKACDDLGSPFTALLCRLIADRLDPASSRFAESIATWAGDARKDALSLRAVGGLHALARSGRVPALTAAYPPGPTDAEQLWSAVVSAMAKEDAVLTAYLDGPPQTNEVARSSTILGGALLIARQTGLPLEIYEIGSSAGLNLNFDRYRYDLGLGQWGAPDAPVRIVTRWEGEAPPLDQPLSVVARAGCDVRPLDPSAAADRARLMSYIWADQTLRLERTAAALALAAKSPTPVAKSDAAAWVERGVAQPPRDGVTRVVLHTIVWQYMPQATQQRIEAAIRQAGSRATPRTPLAWFRVENDEVPDSAGISLTLWPGGETRSLGRADFHGRWTRWTIGSAAG